ERISASVLGHFFIWKSLRVFQAINDLKPVTILREENTHSMTIGHFFSWNTLIPILRIKLNPVKLIQ
ncbi:hypothetical protein QHH03_23210, partial [Aphanizomenon sp. 202]|nr:hypothetical protein [Aphanizomenon sp. 202]